MYKKLAILIMIILTSCAPLARQALPTATQAATIQASLNAAKPGDVIIVRAGVYNESLTTKISGTADKPITLKCETPLACTINSGAANTLFSRYNYYIIDGFRLISSKGGGQNVSTIDIDSGVWLGIQSRDAGAAGLTFRNCYVEGSLHFYGHHMTVEGCEFNGRKLYAQAIYDKFGTSHDNIYRNNVVHDYTMRGIWTMQWTDNILIEGNTLYNIGNNSGLDTVAIDCDGAGNPVYRCIVRNNTIYSTSGVAILFENSFDSLAESNMITGDGIGVINYGLELPTDNNIEYRDDDLNTIIRYNVIRNTSTGITGSSANGVTVTNNTIYNNAVGTYGGITLTNPDTVFFSRNWTVKNNIVVGSGAAYFIKAISPGYDLNLDSNNNFFDTGETFKRHSLSPSYTWQSVNLSTWQGMGHDETSKTGNPLFVDAAGGNFHLQPNSPACGYGAFACTGTPPTVTNTPTLTLTPTKAPTPTATRTRTPTPIVTATAECVQALNVWVCDKKP